ncbi:MAG: hypothetical protein ABI140_11780 [Jatrophihabitantaceae bacterium]
MATKSTPPVPWSLRKLRIVAAIGGVVVLCLFVGGVLFLIDTFTSAGHGSDRAQSRSQPSAQSSGVSGSVSAGGTTPSPDAARQDALAAKPMKVLSEQAFQPHSLSMQVPGVLTIPRAKSIGPAGVPSGFPHTPSGALAQMAAIDQTALQSKQLVLARAVLAAWAMPGGPSPQSWSRVVDLRDTMGPTLSDGSAASWALTFTPIMGQIKGTVEPDFVLPCVDYELDGTIATTARVGVGLCARMVWHAGRWMIGPGAEPYPAPSAWPDTDDAISAGYLDLRHQ